MPQPEGEHVAQSVDNHATDARGEHGLIPSGGEESAQLLEIVEYALVAQRLASELAVLSEGIKVEIRTPGLSGPGGKLLVGQGPAQGLPVFRLRTSVLPTHPVETVNQHRRDDDNQKDYPSAP